MATQNNFIVKNGIVVATTATFQSTATSNSTITGAVIVAGGMGIGGSVYVGGVITATNIYVNSSPVLTAATVGGVNSVNGTSGTVTISAGTDTAISTSSTNITIWNTGTLQTVTSRGAVTDNRVTFNNGLSFGSTANHPIAMSGSYTNLVPSFSVANGTLVGTTETNKIYAVWHQHTVAPVSTATINWYYGYLMIPTLSNTATYANMYGVFSRIDMNASAVTGSVDNWFGFSSENPIRDAASDVRIVNHFGFRAVNPVSVTATNAYGFASLIVSSTVSNRWNIYASGTAPNYFNGYIGIGTTTTYSGEKLSVNGDAYINGVLTATYKIYSLGAGRFSVGTDGLVQVGGSTHGTIELGDPNRTTEGTPYIDFHSSTSTNDYDSRIIAIGGTTTGSGILQIVASKLLISSTSSSTGTNTGALTIAGGAGIGGALYVGGNVAIASGQYVTFGGGSSTRITRDGAANGLDLQTAAVSRLFIADTDGAVTIRSTTSSTSTNSGALVVKGGVGIGGSVYIANTSYINGAEIVTTATIGLYAAASANNASSTGTTSTFLINNTTTSTGTSTGALQVRGGAGIGGNVYIGGTSYINNSQILTSATIYNYTALRGQYIPRTAYVSTGTITIDAGQYDTYVATVTNNITTIQINTDNGYTPFDGQKLIIRLTDDGTARLLSWTYGLGQFNTVGIAPPQITSPFSIIYLGVMYNQISDRWDILSVIIQ
jgi:hypothetical protein